MYSFEKDLANIIDAASDDENWLPRLAEVKKTLPFYSFSISNGITNPYLELIKLNNMSAFRRLLSFTNKNRFAIEALAYGKEIHLLSIMITKPCEFDDAVCGAALGDHYRLVKELFAKGARVSSAIYGAALGHKVILLRKLMAEGANWLIGIYGAATGGHEKLASALRKIPQSASAVEAVIRVAEYEGFFSRDDGVLRFLCEFESRAERVKYAKALQFTRGINKNCKQLMDLSFNFESFDMIPKKFRYFISHLDEGLRTWLCMDSYNLISNTIDKKILAKITSYLLPTLSENEIVLLQSQCRNQWLGKNTCLAKLTRFKYFSSHDEKSTTEKLIDGIKKAENINIVYQYIKQTLEKISNKKIDSYSIKKSLANKLAFTGLFYPVKYTLAELLLEEMERLEKRFELSNPYVEIDADEVQFKLYQ